MLLNLSIICDYLTDRVVDSHVGTDMELNLSRACEFSGDETSLRRDCLYVVRIDELDGFLATTRSKVSLAVTGSYVEADLPARLSGISGWILLEESLTKSDATTLVSSVFEHYKHWRDDIYRSVLRHDLLGETLQICARPFDNPFAVVDMFATVLGIAGTPPAQPDAIWRSVLDKGLSPLESTTNEVLRSVCETEGPVTLGGSPDFPGGAACALRIDGSVVALIGMSPCKTPITRSQLSLLEVLRQTLDETRVFEFLAHYSQSRMSAAFSRLLRGDPVEESAVTFALRRWDAESAGTFQALFFYMDGVSNIAAGQEVTLSRRLDRILPGSIISPFDEGVIAILKRSITEEDSVALSPMLDRYRIRCAASDPFSTFTYLRYAYLQCRAVMSVTKSEDPCSLTSFSEKYEDYLFASLDSSTSLTSLCDSRVLELSKSERGAELVQELRVYLAEGRNVAVAAKKLYLHRNTLGYRIESLEKTLGIDLHAADESQLFHLLLSCLIAERME